MVSFSCEVCNDTLAKKKLDQHRNQCRGATFTCLDCMTHFAGFDYRSHTSCISEAQKYQGHLYRDKKSKAGNNKGGATANGEDVEMVPRKAYVEDVPESEDSQAVAVVDVPPRAPTPPPTQQVNVFDFLVGEATPQAAVAAPEERMKIEQAVHYQNGDSQHLQKPAMGLKPHFTQSGFEYGRSPVQPSLDRFDSWADIPEMRPSAALMGPPSSYITPAPKGQRREKRNKEVHASDKKRKRQVVEELDLTSAKRPLSRDEPMPDRPTTSSGGRILHSGLTGGLSKLVTDPDFYNDRIDAGPTPISPIKRSKRNTAAADDRAARHERRKSSYISYDIVTTKVPSSKTGGSQRSRSHERPLSTSFDDQPSRRRHHRRASNSSSESPDPRASSRLSSHRHENGTSSRRRDSQLLPPQQKAIEYHPPRTGSVQPTSRNSLVSYRHRADLFLSFVKGPDSQHGCSINKVLKRYHRERDAHGDERDDDDKELWKSLRLRRNDRGEIVLFVE